MLNFSIFSTNPETRHDLVAGNEEVFCPILGVEIHIWPFLLLFTSWIWFGKRRADPLVLNRLFSVISISSSFFNKYIYIINVSWDIWEILFYGQTLYLLIGVIKRNFGGFILLQTLFWAHSLLHCFSKYFFF